MDMKHIKIIHYVFSLAAISLAICLLVGGNDSLASDTNQMETLKPAPGWQLKDLNGKSVRSTDFKGKVVVLDFWATWCPPCRAEISDLVALQKKYAAQGLTVVGVSVDQIRADSVKVFAEKNSINYSIVLTDKTIEDAFGGIDALPTTFIIDRSGHIVKQHLGFTAPAEFEKEVISLLAQ